MTFGYYEGITPGRGGCPRRSNSKVSESVNRHNAEKYVRSRAVGRAKEFSNADPQLGTRCRSAGRLGDGGVQRAEYRLGSELHADGITSAECGDPAERISFGRARDGVSR